MPSDALHLNGVDNLEPEFSVVRNGPRTTVPDLVLLRGVRHDREITCDGNRRHNSFKVHTSGTRTLDEAAKQCAEELFRRHREWPF